MNYTTSSQKNLPVEFKDCAAITTHSVIDFLDLDNESLKNESSILLNIGKSASIRSLSESSPNKEEARVCFLDEKGDGPLRPTDINAFDYIIVGGILGDHPPKDKGGHLRGLGLAVRHLGPRQMSTDTAVLACATVLRHQVPIECLTYHDDPEVFQDELPFKDVLEIAPTAETTAYRESTAVRMRYLSLVQPSLVQHPAIPLTSELASTLGEWSATGQGFVQELQEDETQLKIKPRITPGLLEHIFQTADDGLFDFDGALDIDDGEFDEEDKKALDTLFDV